MDSMGSYGEGPDCGCSISIPDVITVIVKTKEQLEEERLAKEQEQEREYEAMRKLRARLALGEKIAKEKGNTVCCKRCYYAETHPFTGDPSCDLPDYIGEKKAMAYAKEKGVYNPYLFGNYRLHRLLNVDRDCRYFRQSNIIEQLFKQVKQVFNLK